MPRIARPIDPEVLELARAIQIHCDTQKISVNRLARDIGVSQPALGRFVKGQRKTIGLVARKARDHLHNWHIRHKTDSVGTIRDPSPPEAIARSAIDRAIDASWDGSASGARLLAAIIEAAAPILRLAGRGAQGKDRN